MTNLNDVLSKIKEGDGDVVEALENLPDQGGQRLPLRPEARYQFKLPAKTILEAAIEVVDYKDKEEKDRQTVVLVAQREAALTITRAKDDEYTGQPFGQRISGFSRARGKEKIQVSDFDYLLSALGEKGKLSGLRDRIEKLLAHAGGEFQADVEWSAFCNDSKPVYYSDGQGGTTLMDGKNGQPAKVGCRTRFYSSKIPRLQDGSKAEEITCGCGAVLRVFENLARFGPAQA